MRLEKIPDSNPVNKWRPASVVIPGNATDSLQLHFSTAKHNCTTKQKYMIFFNKQQQTKSAVSVKIILINLQLIKCESPEEPGIY